MTADLVPLPTQSTTTWVDPAELVAAEPFRSVFGVKGELLQQIIQSMRENGYDPHQPLVVWDDAFGESGKRVILDGHTRHAAALATHVGQVAVVLERHPDAERALRTTVRHQAMRRNMSRGEIAIFATKMAGQLVTEDGRKMTSEDMATFLGVSTTTMNRALGIIDYPDLVQAVLDEELSLVSAYEKAIKRRRDAGETKRSGRPRTPKQESDRIRVDMHADPAVLADMLKQRLANHPDREALLGLVRAVEAEAKAVALTPSVVDDVSMATSFVLRCREQGFDHWALLGL